MDTLDTFDARLCRLSDLTWPCPSPLLWLGFITHPFKDPLTKPSAPSFPGLPLQLRLCPQCCVNLIICSSLSSTQCCRTILGENCITMADWFHYTFMNHSASVGQPLPLSHLLILWSTFSHFPSAAAPDLHSLHPNYHHYLPHSGQPGLYRDKGGPQR